MCGICGFISTTLPPDRARDIVRDMTAALTHRGPDADGFFDDPTAGVYFGHRRLSIIDLSDRARQPLLNEDRSSTIICNGELYGFNDLRRDLEARGHRFTSHSDSEVMLHAYEEWGYDCWNRFNGIFAAAIYERRQSRVVLARDSFGVKPLLYLEGDGWLAFASEFRALRCIPSDLWVPRLDLERAAELLDYPHLLDPETTLIDGMRMLPPATFLAIDLPTAAGPVSSGGMAAGVSRPEPGTAPTGIHTRLQRYWTLQFNPETDRLDWPDACRAVETDLLRAVDKQMVADVPVGILLSGGLDSSTIAALAARRAGRTPVQTFTAVFNHGLDERSHARAVAEHIGSRHTEVTIDPAEVNRRFEEIVTAYDDLRSVDGGLFSLFLIGEKIRPFGIKVLLFGEGADEIFGGYSWFGLALKPFCWMPRRVRSAIHHYAVSRTFLRPSNRRHAARFDRLAAAAGEHDIFRQVARMEIGHQLPNHFLMKVDHATMAHGLEGRVPFLDRDLVERVFSLPRRYKYDGNWFRFSRPDEKHILRAVAAPYLPRAIVARKKQGFLIPMAEVLKSNPDKVRDYVSASRSITRQLLPRQKIERLFDYRTTLYSPLHKEKEFLLWRCFMLDVWASVYHLTR